VVADVVGNTPGNLVNTSGSLTSSAGDSGPASATLLVLPQQAIPTQNWWGLFLLGCLIASIALWLIRTTLKPAG
jgi:hypothetical protein